MCINIKAIENNVKGTLEIEGKIPSTECQKITRLFLEGEISSKQAIERIKKLWGVKS